MIRSALLSAVTATFFTAGCGWGRGGDEQSTIIRVDGSDTMVNLAQAWAETYHKKRPDVSVQVLGSGSGVGIAALIVLQMWLVLSQPAWQGMNRAGAGILGVNNIQVLGRLTFTEYVFPLQIAGVILLVAIIAAIALTLRGRKDSKSQDPSRQVKVRREDRVRLMAMPSETEARQTKNI